MPQEVLDYEQLATQLALKMASGLAAYKGVAPGTPSNVYAHGPGGLLSPQGLRPGLANAMILPGLGLLARLPARSSNETNPLSGIFTGVTATTGDEPSTRCDDPPTAGQAKICTQQRTFGWFGRRSRELRLDRFGLIINRGEFTDMMLVGNPFMAADVPAPAVPNAGNAAAMINTEYGKLAFELAVAMLRDSACDVYTGNPSNNSGVAGDSGREYYRGLDLLINTGYQDAVTGQACPAADSIVRDFNNANITTNTTAQMDIIRETTYILRNLKYIAARAGMAPVQHVLAMRWGLFYELTSIWPCAYQTYRCSMTGTNMAKNADSMALNRMTDDMRGDQDNRTGQYLLVDGQRIPVIIDDCPTETETAPGVFSSDIYFVPITVRGGGSNAPVSEGGNLATYIEYANFDREMGPMFGARMMAPPGVYETAVGGRFLFHRLFPDYMCVQIAGFMQPRLMLETPYLAARLQNVGYTPLIHEREPFTSDAYFVDGGRTDFLGFGPSYYPPVSS
jgi:hypothetical protein